MHGHHMGAILPTWRATALMKVKLFRAYLTALHGTQPCQNASSAQQETGTAQVFTKCRYNRTCKGSQLVLHAVFSWIGNEFWCTYMKMNCRSQSLCISSSVQSEMDQASLESTTNEYHVVSACAVVGKRKITERKLACQRSHTGFL